MRWLMLDNALPSLHEVTLVSGKVSAQPRQHTPRPFGPFVLERRIAVGGSAEVFKARPRTGMRPAPELVIKRLLGSEHGPNAFRTLTREADLLRSVNHPNVVAVFGAGMVGTEPYLAMEYVPGVDLHRLWSAETGEGRAFDPCVAIYVAYSVALALHAVHTARDEKGTALDIRHGDVSPSNIYLSVRGEVKLGDFGVARSSPGSSGVTQRLEGKFGYLAPEQLSGEAHDHRADLFALGVVFGEMLTGRRIFPGNGRLAISLAIREGNVEPLRRAADRLPPGPLGVCLRALERDPAARHENALAFADALRAELDEPRARRELTALVASACDEERLARRLEQRVLESVRARAGSGARPSVETSESCEVRRSGACVRSGLSVSELLELAATGQLRGDDEVSLMGEPLRSVASVEELARYLMPSTTSTTARLFEPGVPDFTAELSETPMLEVLARMRLRGETGVLFVQRAGPDGSPEREELYLASGKLVHVAGEREELLRQYLERQKLAAREQLDLAARRSAELGVAFSDALVDFGSLERRALMRASRALARDRIAATCSWRGGRVQFYRGAEPARARESLDLDLTVPMMAGAMQLPRQSKRSLAGIVRLHGGRRVVDAEAAAASSEVPRSLRALVERLGRSPLLAVVLADLRTGGDREVSLHESRAAVIVALALEWARGD